MTSLINYDKGIHFNTAVRHIHFYFWSFAQNLPTITLKLDKKGGQVSPKFYGLMTEEINYSYDGGL